ncbi:MAG TPA: hypothetical protein PLW65_20275 [Pseudomonadota bacterium]|nr:hypothetical protein [Pseudomonadota bacterium]
MKLSTGADLLALDQLDQKLWVALACPVKGLEFDARTLELLDTEKDGRIRASELLGACKWVGTVLKDPEDLAKGSAELLLTSIKDSTEEGRSILAAAKAVLESAGKAGSASISVAEASEGKKLFDQRPFNGDGVVTPDAATEPAVQKAVADVVACLGGTLDLSGKQGFTAEQLGLFFTEAAAYLEWHKKAEGSAAIWPLKEATADAVAALTAVKAKVDDYFARGRLAAFDARALGAVNREEKEYLPIAAQDLTMAAPELAAFPLAQVESGRALRLHEGVNPAWKDALGAFADKVVTPLLGERAQLTEAEWLSLRGRLDGYNAWQAEKAGARVEQLGIATIRELVGGKMRAALEALLAKEAEQAPVAASLTALERLVRYQRDLLALANNFVAFKDFYERRRPAVFQVGTLYLDQRSCELCLRVDDAGKHATMAPYAGAYLAYCDCVRPASGEKLTIAAAFTNGDTDNLMVGRNGVFYDRQGVDWDATITKIIDNPISIRQAFWSPYKKLLRFVEEQINKRTAAADSAANAKLTGSATEVAKAADTGKAEPPKPTKGIDVGTVAALGVAVGGITAALGALLGGFLGLGMWMPLGFLSLILAISGPSMAIAWLKLRRRNLAPLLDAAGWAVNARARLNVPLGASLTRLAVLPPGSSRSLSDPFAEKPRRWGLWFIVLLVLGLSGAWYLGKLDHLLPTPAKSVTVLGSSAPAAPAEAK